MKKNFVRPSIETCEFVVAARLEGSGVGTGTTDGHSAGGGNGGGCNKTSSNGKKSCALPSSPTSAGGNKSCFGL